LELFFRECELEMRLIMAAPFKDGKETGYYECVDGRRHVGRLRTMTGHAVPKREVQLNGRLILAASGQNPGGESSQSPCE
jgi:hypothetical protein